MENTKRNSSIELLRILCMVMIILHHYSFHGMWTLTDTFQIEDLSGNVILIQLLSLWGRLACNVFILITGYYLSSAKKVKEIKVIDLCATLILYPIISFIFLKLIAAQPYSNVGISDILHSIFIDDWFCVGYVILCFLAPYLNIWIGKVDLATYKKLLVILLLFWSVIPTISFGKIDYLNSDVDTFIVMYLLGGYFRRNQALVKNSNKDSRLIKILLGSVGFMIVFVLACDFASLKLHNQTLLNIATTFLNLNRIPAVLVAISLFLIFIQHDYYSKVINQISKSMIGVYLIHDGLLRKFIWGGWWPNAKYLHSDYLWLHAFLKVAIVFILCTAIDQLRIMLLEPIFNRFVRSILKSRKTEMRQI